ncbi:hypothetical protein SISSUDRAFT_623283 [Sistotremastrum suecicum HHB10207 ss-3]|uniref:Uncharacterized protein n=1 Tax=Sistotremastrum suecicum HHB10207 ss-3 TaxID=1314776 RepID=A0A166EIN3_9AGAM|nr:hypothetical protein SISSUDRAFT_623283 [Sistotremastrum suecicum HHB10207 ss-3]
MESHVAQFFAEEHDDVEFDSERFNEEVIAVPRLSTITEKTEATEVPRRSKLASLAASRTSNISGSRTPSATPVGSRSHGPPAFRTASLSSQIPYAPSYASTVPSERSHQGMRPVSATSHRHIQEVDASPSLTSLSGMAQSLPQIPGSSAHSIASASRNSASSIKTKLSSRKGSVLENEVASETTTSPTPIIPASAATSPSTAPSEAGTTRPSSKLANLAQVRVHREQPPKVSSHSRTVMTNEKIPATTGNNRSLTVTTAITTTFQTPQSIVGLGPSGPKPVGRSKLAQRVRQAQLRPGGAEATAAEVAAKEEQHHPLFPRSVGNVSHRGSPSPFGELLIHETSSLTSKPSATRGLDGRNSPIVPLSTRQFAFDVPSPDDLVLRARAGTSMARS